MELFRPTLILGVILPLIYAVLFLPGCLFADFSLTIKRQVASDFCKSLYVYHFITIANAFGALVGLFMKASDLLKWSLILAFWSTTAIALYFMLTNHGIAQQRHDFMEIFSSCMKYYDWKSSSYINKLSNNCAILLDRTQGESCCGVNSFKDWDKYRPEFLKSDSIYPESCCPSPQTLPEVKRLLCIDDSDLYRVGCAESGKEFWSKLVHSHTAFALYQTILFIFVSIYWLRMKPDDLVDLIGDSSTVNNRPSISEITLVQRSNYGQASLA